LGFFYQKTSKMKSKSIIEHITEADDNLYADLGFGPEEAARFQAESDARISASTSASGSNCTAPLSTSAMYF
jgi:hypothetical protein